MKSTPIQPFKPEIVWETTRPEGATLSAEIRNFNIIEAYDRQILHLELALENSGIVEISDLTLGISLGSDLPEYILNAVTFEEPALIRGERRVWPAVIGIPLDADLQNRIVTITVKEP